MSEDTIQSEDLPESSAQGARDGSSVDLLALGAVVLAAVAAAPAYVPWGIYSFVDFPMALLGMCLVCVAAIVLTEKEPAGAGSPVGRAFLAALAAVVLLSLALSDYRIVGLFGSPATRLGLIVLVPVALLAVLGRGVSARLAVALRAVAPVIMGLWAAVAVYQRLSGLPESWGLSSNSAVTAQLFVLLLPLVLTWAGRRVAYRVSIGVAVAAVLWFVGSALGVALALGWTAIDAVLLWRGRAQVPRWLPVSLPAVHLVLSAVLVGAVLASPASAPSALGSRPQIWRAAVDLAAESLVLGAGPGSFANAVNRAVTPASAFMENDWPYYSTSAHSIWVEVGGEYGLLGVLALLAAATYIASRWSTNLRSAGGVAATGLVLFSVTLLLQPLPMQVLPMLALVLAASLPLARPVPETPQRVANHAARLAAPVAGVVLGVVLVAYGVTLLVVGEPQDTPASLKFTQAAARVWRMDPELWAQTAFRAAAEAQANTGSAASAAAAIDAALGRAVELSPNEFRYNLNLAQAGEATGQDPARIRELYDAAFKAAPLSPVVIQARGLFLASQGDQEGAREAYDLLLRVYPVWTGTAQFKAAAANLGLSLE